MGAHPHRRSGERGQNLPVFQELSRVGMIAPTEHGLYHAQELALDRVEAGAAERPSRKATSFPHRQVQFAVRQFTAASAVSG